MEFPAKFIQWVRSYVTTPMFSVVLNGALEGYFPGKRGLRQGGPLLSPYLFLLVMDGFTSLLPFKVQQQGFTFHPKCKSLNITHLIFAHDLFVLCGADAKSFQLIKEVLSEFHMVYGTST